MAAHWVRQQTEVARAYAQSPPICRCGPSYGSIHHVQAPVRRCRGIPLLCLVLPVTSLAQEGNRADEIRQLQSLLGVINAELKADLDQVLVLQEAIRGNTRKTLAAQGRSPDIVTVDSALAADRRAIEREDAINA